MKLHRFGGNFLIGLLVLSTCSSCSKKEELPQKNILGIGGDTWPKDSMDDYISQNFTIPYNIQVKYKWDPYEVSFTKTLIPVDEKKVIPVMDVVKKVWIDPYEKVTGNTGFIKKFAPKQFVLVGSAEYNTDGTIKLGQAEGGRKILLLKLNDFDKKKRPEVIEMMHTIQHEFGHILHQNILYPEAFKSLNPEGYTGTWYNLSNEDANKQGFVTNYAKSTIQDDFVETIAYLLIEGQDAFDAIITDLESDITDTKLASMKAAGNLRQKQAIIISYYKSAYGIDFNALQAEVQNVINNL